jgi:integrase
MQRLPSGGVGFAARHVLALDAIYGQAHRAGLPEATRLQDLRHTCATLLLAQGTHPRLVQERLAHPTVAMTLDPTRT